MQMLGKEVYSNCEGFKWTKLILVVLYSLLSTAMQSQTDSLGINDYPDTIYSEYRLKQLDDFYDEVESFVEPEVQQAIFDTVPKMIMIKPGYKGDKIPEYEAIEDQLVIVAGYWEYTLRPCEKVKIEKWLQKSPIEYVWLKNKSAALLDCPPGIPTDSCHWKKVAIKQADFYNYSYELCKEDFQIDSVWHKQRVYDYVRFEIKNLKDNPRDVPYEMKSKQMLLNTYPLKQEGKLIYRKSQNAIRKEELISRYLFKEITPFNYWEEKQVR